MNAYTPESEEITLVVLGSFNPTIYQPEWFIRKELIAEQEMSKDSVELHVVHKDITRFENDWFLVEVNPDRFLIKAKLASRVDSLRDLACSIFAILSETPIRSFGLNYIQNYRCSTLAAWHSFGHALVPKAKWAKATGLEESYIGMKEVEVRIQRDDDIEGSYNVKIAPLSDKPPKIMIQSNDHVEYEKMGNPPEEFSSYLHKYWDCSLDQQRKLINNIVSEIGTS